MDKALNDPAATFTPSQRRSLEDYRETLVNAERNTLLDAHNKNVVAVQNYRKAISSVAALALKGSPEIETVSKSFDAGINILDGVGRMSINGALDPTGISAIAGGVAVMASLIGPQAPSATDIIIGMLKTILENQKKMIEQLKSIEQKVDVLDDKLNYVIAKLDAMDDTLRYNFLEFQGTLARYALDDERRSRESTMAILEQVTLREARDDLEELTDPSVNVTPAIKQYRRCMAASNACSTTATTFFAAMERHIREVRRATEERLVAPPYYEVQNLDSYDEAQLRARIADVATGYEIFQPGWLSSEAVFLNRYLDIGMSKSYSPTSQVLSVQPQPNTKANPYLLTASYIPLYTDLVTHLPATYSGTGHIVSGLNMFRGKLDDVRAQAQEMRIQADHARMAFVYNGYFLAVRAQRKLDRLAASNNLSENILDLLGQMGTTHWFDEQIGKLTSVFPRAAPPVDARLQINLADHPPGLFNGSYYRLHPQAAGANPGYVDAMGVLFSGVHDSSLYTYFSTMSDEEFVKIGTTIGAFKLKDEPNPYREPGCTPRTSRCWVKRVTWYDVDVTDGANVTLKNHQIDLNAGSPYRVTRIVTYWDPGENQHTPDSQLTWLDARPGGDQEKRSSWQKLLVAFVRDKQQEILRSFVGEISQSAPNKDDIFTKRRAELARAYLVLDTFYKGGYGECLEIEPGLKPLRDILEFSKAVDADYAGMTKARDLDEVVIPQINAATNLLEIAQTPIPDIPEDEYQSGCRLGWGSISAAKAALDRADRYNGVSRRH